MPDVGDVETKFGRRYMFVNVNPALGPGTWRLSMPEDYPGSGGGGGTGGFFDIDGVLPIVADQQASGETTISLDITELENIDP